MSVAKSATLSFPKRIDLNQLNDVFTWQGDIDFSRFSRLVLEVSESEITVDENALKPITLDCILTVNTSSGPDDNELVLLKVNASGRLPQQCQRCLQQVDTLMQVNETLVLLTDEAFANQLDDDADFIILSEAHGLTTEDDALSVDLLRVIEDELLLTLPISPKHDDCDMIMTQVGETEETPKDNPFAQLADLKNKLSKKE